MDWFSWLRAHFEKNWILSKQKTKKQKKTKKMSLGKKMYLNSEKVAK